MRDAQRGQILLIVVLTMIVALTVGLSIAARIVTELKLSKQNEESQRAFQAAEAGIQQTLERQASINTPILLDNNAQFSTLYEADSGPAIVVNNGLEVDQSVGADVWLSDYSPDPTELFLNPMGNGNPVNITIYWGSPTQTSCVTAAGEASAPAIEVSLLKGPISNPTIERNIFEAAGCNRLNNAVQGTTAGGPYVLRGTTFRNSANLTFNGSSLSNGLIMKVIPVYNSSVIGFQSSISFPPQGSVVTSTGTSGDTVRKVIYYQSYPQLPLEVFPYSILSQ